MTAEEFERRVRFAQQIREDGIFLEESIRTKVRLLVRLGALERGYNLQRKEDRKCLLESKRLLCQLRKALNRPGVSVSETGELSQPAISETS